jgi:hypothetical protein
MMKKTLVAVLTLALVVSFTFTMAFAGPDNKLPVNGTHFNLNLLGKDNCPGGDMIDSNRHTIFVKLNFSDADANNILGDNPGNYVTLDRTNKIYLFSGNDFQVTDGNACNKGGAAFYLPANVATNYEFFVRELGKPGGTGDIVTCGVDAGVDGIPGNGDDEIVCSTGNAVTLERAKGKSMWQNVTSQLTTINYLVWVDANLNGVVDPGETTPETANLFDPDFYQYLWDYDNNGLRLVQIRIYPKPIE